MTIVRAFILCTATLAISIGISQASLFPPDYMGAVVSLGTTQTLQEPNKAPITKWITAGTGFFYGYLVHDDSDVTKKKYAVFLVTARHVIKSFAEAGSSKIELRVDPVGATGVSQNFLVPLSDWFFHLTVDLAAAPISIEFLKSRGLQNSFFANDSHTLTTKQMAESGVSAGDGVFIPGFPMGLSGAYRNYVIVRQGAVARISELLDGNSSTFLVDALVFPGNSGGPVILKPEITYIEGTKAHSKAALIGVVKSYETYIDTAFSQQTRRARIIFEENSGLADVIPTDFINEMVKDKAESIWQVEQQRTAPAPLAFPSLPPQSPLFPSMENPLLKLPK
jgi:hypothetical protein